MIQYGLLLASVMLETTKNIFSNRFSKEVLKNETDIYKFNTFLYFASFLVLLFFPGMHASGFTVGLSVVFAAVTAASQHFAIKAFQTGPMAHTSFIQGVGLVIPTFCGVLFWQEKMSAGKLFALLVLIISMALVLDLKKEKINLRWLVYALLSMLFIGLIGVVQTVHQMSPYQTELIPFLKISFFFTVLLNLLFWRLGKTPSTFSIKSSAAGQAAASGVFMGLVNMINLYLAGAMPKIIFFPIANGGLIFATLLAAVIFFRERLSKKQWVGMMCGILALCAIGL